MNVPFSFDEINTVAGTYVPSTQKPYNNQTFEYWRRALVERASYVLDFDLPEEWSNDLRGLFISWLFRVGFLAVFAVEYVYTVATETDYPVYSDVPPVG